MIESSLVKNPLALIVEDNTSVMEIFKIALERAGFEVEHMGDGRTALERLAVVTPMLVLLDLHLPHVSGEQVLHYIRVEERLAKTRVILASADLFKIASLEHKADFVLVKPFGFNQLYNLAKQVRFSLIQITNAEVPGSSIQANESGLSFNIQSLLGPESLARGTDA